MPKRAGFLLLSLLLASATCFAKKPELVMTWPQDNPTLKLTFGKVRFQCAAVGQPTTLSIAAHNSAGVPTSTRLIPIMIISVPPGATLRVDDKLIGTTPITVRMISGTHNLELQKDRFAVAKTPLDVNPDEAPGGSITITLGGLADDTIELRDLDSER